MNLDLYFFNLIHGLSGRKKWLDFWGIFCAKYLGYVLAVILCAAAFMAKNAVIFIMPILSGCFSRFVINELIYFFYKRKRPAQTMPIKSLVKIPRYPAFPSGHASFFFALSFALLPFNFNLAVIFIIASFLISFGRIFVGVHWPADILGGIIAGGFSAILMKLDLHFFNLINGLAGSWSWPDYLGIFLAKYFEYFLWFCLILFLAVNFKKYWKMVLQAFVAGILARFVLAEIIRWLWFRPRPFVSLSFAPLINQSAAEASFPSGHASFYFALSTIVYFYNKKAGILFYIASFLIVISRIFVGVHWPLDILAGAILGVLTAWILNKLLRAINFQSLFGRNQRAI